MDGIDVSGRMLKRPSLTVTASESGVYIGVADDAAPEFWLAVNISHAALWALVNMCGGASLLPEVPPPPLLDMGDVIIPLPSFPEVPPLT